MQCERDREKDREGGGGVGEKRDIEQLRSVKGLITHFLFWFK